MKSRLSTFLAAVSLLLFVAVCGLWVRSQFVRDRIVWAEVQKQPHASVETFNIFTHRGSIELTWDRQAYMGPGHRKLDPGGPTHLRWKTSPPDTLLLLSHWRSFWNKAGFVFDRSHDTDSYGHVYDHAVVAVPHWAAALLTLLPAAAWLVTSLRRWRALGRRNLGLCTRCGYNLRASKERCPECGESVVAAQKALS